MLNTIMNAGMRMLANKGLKKYQQYPQDKTALVLVDIQKEFLVEGSAGYSQLQTVAESNNMMKNLERLINFATVNHWPIIRIPYRQYQLLTPANRMKAELDSHIKQYKGPELPLSLQPNESQITLNDRQGLSAFAGTELDHLLTKMKVEHLVIAGAIAKSGLDSTVRDAVEIGYHATVISDCSASYNLEEHKAWMEVTLPRFAQTIMSLDKLIKKAD